MFLNIKKISSERLVWLLISWKNSWILPWSRTFKEPEWLDTTAELHLYPELLDLYLNIKDNMPLNNITTSTFKKYRTFDFLLFVVGGTFSACIASGSHRISALGRTCCKCGHAPLQTPTTPQKQAGPTEGNSCSQVLKEQKHLVHILRLEVDSDLSNLLKTKQRNSFAKLRLWFNIRSTCRLFWKY